MRRAAAALIAIPLGAGAAPADELGRQVDMIVTGALGPQTDAERYCRNIADLAREAKFKWQVETISQLEDALKQRTEALELKRAEIETWLRKRQTFMDMAEERLVGIYSKMRPDAASQQIRGLSPVSAAALMMKLQPRVASAILNEMPSADASRLASLMIDATTVEETDAPAEAGPAAGATSAVRPADAAETVAPAGNETSAQGAAPTQAP